MTTNLIDLSLVHVINRSHIHIQDDIQDSDTVPALVELRSRQVRQAEREALRALEKVLEMYESIQMQAVMSRPNYDLQEILNQQGIQQQP